MKVVNGFLKGTGTKGAEEVLAGVFNVSKGKGTIAPGDFSIRELEGGDRGFL